MSEFRQLTGDFWASPQIALDDLDAAKTRGFALIINNRPEGEADDHHDPDHRQREEHGGPIPSCVPVAKTRPDEGQKRGDGR